MAKPIKQNIESQYQKLPPPLKDALLSPEVAEKMYVIGKKFGLLLDQTGELAEETGHIIMGLTRPGEFIATLRDRLQIDEEKAREISQEVNHQIFHPLREILKSTHQFDVSEETIQKEESAIRKPAVTPAITIPPIVVPPAPLTAKKPELRIGREPIEDKLDKNLATSQTPITIPEPPPPITPIAPKPPILTPVKPTPTINLKDEVTKILETPTPTPPAGTMPSWMTKPEQVSRNEIPSMSPKPTVPPAATPPTPPPVSNQPIDLRSQYKPMMPPSSPKVPPINLRELGIKNKELRTETPSSAPPVSPAITRPSVMQESGITPKPQPIPIPRPVEKKMPTSGTDNYREPVE